LLIAEFIQRYGGVGQRVIAPQNTVLQIHERLGDIPLLVLTSLLGNVRIESRVPLTIEPCAINRLIEVEGDETY
jgi:hypothetical protein